MKIALVHDYLREWGGAEEVVAALHEIWQDAPLFTSYVSNSKFTFLPKEQKTTKEGQGSETPVVKDIAVKTSWLNYLPNRLKTWHGITPLLPFAFSSFSLKNYDVVVSSTAAFAKSIDIKKPTIHICYCHTPPRFLYGLQRERKQSSIVDIIEKPFTMLLKWLDQQAAKRVDYFIANSHVVAKRIERVYGREATVIYPPVTLDKFKTNSESVTEDDYFVVIGRLSPIKHIELAIEACNKLHIPLKIIGTGSDEMRLKQLAGETIEFLGFLPDDEAAAIIARSNAAIFTTFDEDFGLTPLEIIAAGKPVIAYASEANQEILHEETTGPLFHEKNAESLGAVLQSFDSSKYDMAKLKNYAATFSKQRFKNEIRLFVEEKVTSNQS